MYQNLIKILQNILFMLLLVIAAPLLFLFALINQLGEKSKTEPSEQENNS